MITVSSEQNPCSDLLEAAAIHAGRHHAQRLLLNIPDDWRLERVVRSSGFFHCMRVLLCTLHGRSPLLSIAPENSFRPRTYADDHSLFQLYNATTTANTRAGIGLTFEQWKDSQEPHRRGTQQCRLRASTTQGGMGSQPSNRFGQWHNLTIAHPMSHQMKPKASVAKKG